MRTTTISTTRPPAVLGVCQEARRIGLTAYKIMEISETDGQWQPPPIYVNPHCDIIYRGRRACLNGDPFYILCWNPKTGVTRQTFSVSVPLQGIEVVAIHLKYIAKSATKVRRSTISPSARIIPKLPRFQCPALHQSIGKSVFSEVTFVPLSTDLKYLSPREKGALGEVERLKVGMAEYWKDESHGNTHIRPHEYDNGRSALQLTLSPKSPKKTKNTTIPSLHPSTVSVEHLTRSHPHIPTPKSIDVGSRLSFWKSGSDTVVMNLSLAVPNNSIRRWTADNKIVSLGMHWKYAASFSKGDDAKAAMENLREIVVLVGKEVADCAMTLVPIDENGSSQISVGVDTREILGALDYAKALRKDVDRHEKGWEGLEYSGE
ncbi:hypothetical protein VTL71DRAFT_16483 [Oculimacula yallundae]|uniref:2EXR domain-containing protein n=1 Tax=Oculimacula yallundae TaxID=86028 RepID=A0ABR4CEL7_9HELO